MAQQVRIDTEDIRVFEYNHTQRAERWAKVKLPKETVERYGIGDKVNGGSKIRLRIEIFKDGRSLEPIEHENYVTSGGEFYIPKYLRKQIEKSSHPKRVRYTLIC